MRRRWFSMRALGLHLTVLIVAPGCLVAGWWQATVAMSGNDLSYVYAVEWPVFSIFSVILWWNLIHDDPNSVGARALRRVRHRSGGAAHDLVRREEEEDPELAAYNAYLAALAEEDRAKSWRRT